jgi:hypothetical protein
LQKKERKKKMRKKIHTYLLGISATVLAFSFNVGSAFASCSLVTDCKTLGYTDPLHTAYCADTTLRCPFDSSFIACVPSSVCDKKFYNHLSCPTGALCKTCKNIFADVVYAVVSCQSGYELTRDFTCGVRTYDCSDAEIGDFVYSDATCSSKDSNPRSDKTVVGIVFDTTYRLAVTYEEPKKNESWGIDCVYMDEIYGNGCLTRMTLQDMANYAEDSNWRGVFIAPANVAEARNYMNGFEDSRRVEAAAGAIGVTVSPTDHCNSTLSSYAPSTGEARLLVLNKTAVVNSLNKLGQYTDMFDSDIGHGYIWTSMEVGVSSGLYNTKAWAVKLTTGEPIEVDKDARDGINICIMQY